MPDAPKRLNIAVALPMVVPGDIALNIERMEPMVAQAAAGGADVILFSECGITGYDHRLISYNAAMPVDDPRFGAVAAMASRHGIVVVAGFYERAGAEIYNAATVYYPDGRRVQQRKHFIVGYEEKHTDVRSGPRRREIFEVKGFKLAILICADSGVKGIEEELAAQGVDGILAPTAGCGDTDLAFYQREMSIPARQAAYVEASKSVCFMGHTLEKCLRLNIAKACTNQLGWVESIGYFHPGHAAVIDRTGDTTALIPGRFIAEHLRPEMAIGFISARA